MAQPIRQLIAVRQGFSFSFLRLVPVLTVGVFLAPVAAGLAATVLPALGYHPALNRNEVGLQSFMEFCSLPGVASSTLLTIRTGFVATLLAFGAAMLFCASFSHTRLFRFAQSLLSPVLATPHSAMAIGLVFLLAPSGWLIRLMSGLLGITRPPNVSTVQDQWGLSFVFAILLKTVPYLILMTSSAIGQVQLSRSLSISRGMGYGVISGWFRTVFPRIYPQIRLPVYAVLTFSLSVVDVALITAPNNPPVLSVYVLRLFNDKDFAMQLPGAAGALLLFLIVVGSILLWRTGEFLVSKIGRRIYISGNRKGYARRGQVLGAGIMIMLLLFSFLSLAVLALWSLAGFWRFPAALPQAFTLATWSRHLGAVSRPARVTVVAGFGAVVLSLVLVLLCLENEDRSGSIGRSRSLVLLYIPLLVPQIAFLFGMRVLFILLGIAGRWSGLIWAHVLFVLPYVYLSLADPWRSLDSRYSRSALCLGVSPWTVFFRVKLPLMLRPLCAAFAIGFAVSAGQYLPTVFAGAGRFATLTTEAVTLASGGNRRVSAVYAFLQAAVPLGVYLAAILLPAWVHRNRADMN
jgi:putative thiamine transport system permease protein